MSNVIMGGPVQRTSSPIKSQEPISPNSLEEGPASKTAGDSKSYLPEDYSNSRVLFIALGIYSVNAYFKPPTETLCIAMCSAAALMGGFGAELLVSCSKKEF